MKERKPWIILMSICLLLIFILAISSFISACAKPASTPVTTPPAPSTIKSTTPTPSTTAPKTSPATTTAVTTTATPQYGGVLKMITMPGLMNIGVPGEMNLPSWDGLYGRPCVESLLTFDEKGNAAPWLATSWQISPDYKSITFTLRKSVKFHDGTDFNAEAAKYNIDTYKAGKLGADLASIQSVDVVDSYTIRLNLSTYDASFMNNLVGTRSMMVSPTALKTLGKDVSKTQPVGTGPYKFVSFQTDVSLKYSRFDGYWGGKPYLDGIEFNFIADPVTALASLKGGEAKVIMRLITPKDARDLKATGKYNINSCPSGIFGLAGDSSHPTSIYADVRIRQAIAYAIDSQAIVEAIGFGLLPSANQLAIPGCYGYNPKVVGYPYNPAKAKELLAATGNPNGFKTTIQFMAKSMFQDAFTAAQGNLRDVGIDAKLDAADPGRQAQAEAGTWNNLLLMYNIPANLTADFLNQLKINLSSKGTKYRDVAFPADYEAKLSQALSELDLQKRAALAQELMTLIVDKYCMVIPIFLNAGMTAQSVDVHDLDLLNLSPAEWHPEKAWISK